MSGWRRNALVMLSMAVMTWVVYGRAVSGEFIAGWDDSRMVRDNPGLNPPTWGSVAAFWRGPVERLYTPLTYTMWAGVAAVDGRSAEGKLQPAMFHILNLLLHWAAGVFAFLLLRELLGSTAQGVGAAWFGGMVFLLHPLQVEAVGWISGMNNLLAGGLGMAGMWQYVKYVKGEEGRGSLTQTQGASSLGVWGRRGHFWVATVLYAGALLAKPTAVVVPLMAGVVDWMGVGRPWRRVVGGIGLWIGMAAVMCAVARVVQTAEGGVGAAWWLRPVVAIDTIGFYATKVVAPVRLAMDYERTPGWVISHWSTAWWVMGVGLMVLVGIWRRRGWVAAGVAMAVVGLLPVLGVVPFDFQAISTVGDRYMYLPMAGVALAAAAVLVRFEGKVAWGVAVVILGVLGGRSFEQAGVWRDTRTLTANQFSFDAGSATGHKVLATWLLEQDQLVEAEEHLRRAIEAFKGSTQQPDGTVWLEYANVLWREGRSAEAIGVFREGIGYQAADKRAAGHDSLGLELMREGKMEEARGEFEEALRLEPGDGVARRNLEGVPLR